jgi:hypothetical protein
LEAGRGRFGNINLKTGKFEEICYCPGFTQGLDFIGNYAVVSLSKSRHQEGYTGLPLDDVLARHEHKARCGFCVIDLKKGKIVHEFFIEGTLKEIQNVTILKDTLNPAMVGFQGDDINKVFYLEEHKEKTQKTVKSPSLKGLIKTHLRHKFKGGYVLDVFGKVTPEIAEALLGFWLKNRVLPRDVDPLHRAYQACLVIVDKDGLVIGDSTVFAGPLSDYQPEASDKDIYYIYRMFTSPDHRYPGTPRVLIAESFNVLKEAVDDQKSDSDIQGMLIIAENPNIDRQGVIRKFKRYKFELLPHKTPKGYLGIYRPFSAGYITL